MTDIVERLRNHQLRNMILREAADEIERLRHENMRLQTAHDYAYDPRDGELSKLNREIGRLRAALGELLSGHDNLYVAHFGPGSNPHDDIAAKPARRALEPKP